MNEYFEEENVELEKPKRTRKPKVVDFKEEARDGDNDGYVQDGTIWERPIEEVEKEVIVLVEEVETINEPDTFYIATTGETYLSIALKYNKGTSYAKEIRQKNHNKAIRTGVIINL